MNEADHSPSQKQGPEIAQQINASTRAGFKSESAQYSDLMDAILTAQPDAIIVGDSTKPIYHMNFCHRAAAPRRWFNSVTGFGTLGYALPAAIGAKVGNPNAPVVAIAGDGGFQFTLNELMTARQENTPIAVIVWNNSAYREIRDYMTDADIAPIGVDVQCPDLNLLAGAMGAEHVKANNISDIQDALRPLKQRPTPLIVEYVPELDA
ncbi:MAG: thiamine pyrophosphate-dependent enzyme [Albidovulum sp.]